MKAAKTAFEAGLDDLAQLTRMRLPGSWAVVGIHSPALYFKSEILPV
jgi:hypothetical protein